MLFLICEVSWNREHHLLVCIWSHGKRLGDLLLLGFCSGMGHDVVFSEVVQKLRWDLHESLLSKQVRIVLELVIRHELHDISGHVLPVALGVESLFVSIEYLHTLKVGITNSNNDNSDWQ